MLIIQEILGSLQTSVIAQKGRASQKLRHTRALRSSPTFVVLGAQDVWLSPGDL